MKMKEKSVSPVRRVVQLLLFFSLLILLFQLTIQIDTNFNSNSGKIDNQLIVKDEIEVQTPVSLENLQFDETLFKLDYFELFFISAFIETACHRNAKTQLHSIQVDILIPPPRFCFNFKA